MLPPRRRVRPRPDRGAVVPPTTADGTTTEVLVARARAARPAPAGVAALVPVISVPVPVVPVPGGADLSEDACHGCHPLSGCGPPLRTAFRCAPAEFVDPAPTRPPLDRQPVVGEPAAPAGGKLARALAD